jgi:hypothetical protein
LIKLPVHDHAEAFLAVMADARFKELRGLLFECITVDGERLTVNPIVERMYETEYAKAYLYRQALEQLAFGKTEPELRTAIETNLAALKRDELSIRQQPLAEDTKQLQNFMHTLFLEEYRLSPKEVDEQLIDTISEFQIIAWEEKDILVDMHLAFLKRSELFASWQALMA